MKQIKVFLLALIFSLAGFGAFGSEGVEDVIRLEKGGIDQNVMLAFVNNNAVAYDLSADEIQRLEDENVPPSVVVAMIDHGKQMRGEMPRLAAPAVVPAAAAPAVYAPPPEDLNISFFYEALSPHGLWIHDPTYGNVWQPAEVLIQTDWQPYSYGGQWAWSDHGWYFESEYPWSWAAFHYGRWYNHPQHHWLWVPGNDWAASWVDWRQSDDYIGWAPLPPGSRFEAGMGFSFHNQHVGMDFHFGLGENDYAFVPAHRFLEHDIGRARISRTNIRNVYNSTKVVNNTYIFNDNRIINNGIPPDTIARVTKQSVKKLQVEDMKVETGQKIAHEQAKGDKIVVYRPKIADKTTRDPQAAIKLATSKRAEHATEESPARKDGAQEHRAAPLLSEQDARSRLQQEKAKRAEVKQERKVETAVKRDEKAVEVKASSEERKAAVNADQAARREAAIEKRDTKVQETRDAKAGADAQREERSQAVRESAQERKAAAGAEQEVRREAATEKRDARIQEADVKAQERKAGAEAKKETRESDRDEKRDARESKKND